MVNGPDARGVWIQKLTHILAADMVDKSSKQKLMFKRVATVLHALQSGKSVLEILAETQNTIFPHPPWCKNTGQLSNVHHDSA